MTARNFGSVSAVWGKVIADCVVHSKNRHTLRICDAIADYEKFRIKGDTNEPEVAEELISLEIGSMNFPVGKEVVLCRVGENWADIPTGLVVLELYRFSDDCSQRVSFQSDRIILNNDLQFELLRRSATVQGLMRTIEADLSIIDDEQVVVCPIQSDIDFEVGLCADIHRERLRVAVKRNKTLLSCLHCGRPVWEEEASVVEMEPIDEPIVGLSHGRCLAQTDRIIGRITGEPFRTYPKLINFDANAWFSASHGGQIAFSNAESLRTNATPIIAWGGLNPSGPVGDYVVEISLSNGGHEIVTQRNGVHRFPKAEADDLVARFNVTYKAARKELDPICYSDQSKMYGPRSMLIEQCGGRERIIEVSRARVRRYEQRFAARFSRPGQWYAPLLYLKCIKSNEPFTIDNAVILLTEPLKLDYFLYNWVEASIAIPEYETASILSDREFDEFMRWIEARGWVAVANPLFNPADRSLASGLRIGSVERLLEERS